MTHPIRTERRGAVLEVTLDRPKANAIDAATSRIMGEVFAGFRDDPELRAAILTAAGDRFSPRAGTSRLRRRAKPRTPITASAVSADCRNCQGSISP